MANNTLKHHKNAAPRGKCFCCGRLTNRTRRVVAVKEGYVIVSTPDYIASNYAPSKQPVLRYCYLCRDCVVSGKAEDNAGVVRWEDEGFEDEEIVQCAECKEDFLRETTEVFEFGPVCLGCSEKLNETKSSAPR